MTFWLNGTPATDISLADRGLTLGDGHFTTILVNNGHLHLWPLHRQRLQQANLALGFLDPDWPALESQLADIAQQAQRGCVRISFTRGASGRGYQGQWQVTPNCIIQLSPLPAHYSVWQQQGIEVMVADVTLPFGGPLVGIKTLGRAEQVLIKQSLSNTDCDDLLLLDPFANVIEASAGNLFVLIDGVVVTPQLSYSGIAGVMRQQLITAVVQLGYPVQVRPLHLAELAQAQQGVISNCLMGAVPIKQIDGKPMDSMDLAHSLQEQL
ncbi:aminodeoxychorismate lyase [uncultured Ferrimonas sp.]|uniref:aminodeoxychorismate lyase n=1 Tax=uncultured Ferrimonas sp. TaxID=432640 RepID=UPI00262F22BA|nr:aminodeoxychorismate lyase [uncultured Ferrimonas sp.]